MVLSYFGKKFFFDFCSIYCVTSNAAHPETDTLLVGGGVGVGRRVENVLTKIQFFTLVLELYLNAEFFQLFGLQHFQLLLFGFPICNKTLFQFCPRQP